MATFGELQTSVSKRLLDANNTAVSAQDVATALNDAVSYWKFNRFWFNEETFTDNLTENDTEIPLPEDFLVPAYEDGAFFINYSSMRYTLQKIKSQQYDNQYLSNAFGLPRWYSKVSNTWRVYFIPDRDYEIEGRYLKDYTAIEQANYNATNDFTVYAPRLLTLWSCANLIAELRQDAAMEGYYRKAAEDESRQLQKMTYKNNASGRLTNHSTLI